MASCNTHPFHKLLCVLLSFVFVYLPYLCRERGSRRESPEDFSCKRFFLFFYTTNKKMQGEASHRLRRYVLSLGIYYPPFPFIHSVLSPPASHIIICFHHLVHHAPTYVYCQSHTRHNFSIDDSFLLRKGASVGDYLEVPQNSNISGSCTSNEREKMMVSKRKMRPAAPLPGCVVRCNNGKNEWHLSPSWAYLGGLVPKG